MVKQLKYSVLILIVLCSILTVTGKAVFSQVTQPNSIAALSWNQSGDLIGITNNNGQVWIIESESRSHVVDLVDVGFDPEGVDTADVGWSPDGSKFAAVMHKTLYMWDATSWELLWSVTETWSTLWALAWDSSSTQIAVAIFGTFRNLIIWDVILGSEVNYTHVNMDIYDVSWNQVNNLLSTAASNGVAFWEPPLSEVYASWARPGGELVRVEWSPDNEKLGLLGDDDRVFILDATTLNPVYYLEGQGREGFLVVLAWSPDSQHLISGSDDGTLWVWNVAEEQGYQLAQSEAPIYALDWSPDGTQIAYGGANGVVEIIPAPEFLTCDYHVAPNDADGLVQNVHQANLDASATICLEDESIFNFITTTGSSAIPTITGNLTFMPVIRDGAISVKGDHVTLTRDPSADLFRFFEVATGGSLTLNNLTLSHGEVMVTRWYPNPL